MIVPRNLGSDSYGPDLGTGFVIKFAALGLLLKLRNGKSRPEGAGREGCTENPDNHYFRGISYVGYENPENMVWG